MSAAHRTAGYYRFHEGAYEDCRVDLGTANGVHTCVRGERRCRGGVWGPCEGSMIARPVGDEDEAPADGADPGAGDEVSTDEDRDTMYRRMLGYAGVVVAAGPGLAWLTFLVPASLG